MGAAINPKFATMKPETVAMNSLFMKRQPFSHEQEFRFVLKTEDFMQNDYPKFSIDVNSVIETILFDPRISQEEYKKGEKELRELGFRNRISKSSIYTFEPFSIKSK
ncbi:MAG: hypothetical protein ABFC21_02960 [Rectinema sp.]|jgi:hypothetical protein